MAKALLLLMIVVGTICAAAAPPSTKCFPLLFAFGDSLSDTGNAQRIFPSEQSRASNYPYGMTFFKRPRDRFSDGRLLIDFIAAALDLPFLWPYAQSVGSSVQFEHGVNFATSGATASDIFFLVPQSLRVQFYMFQRFMADVKEAMDDPAHAPSLRLPDSKLLPKALFVILIGGNDYNARLLLYNMTTPQLIGTASTVVDSIAQTIEDMYHESGRHFLIINLPPIGCAPELLTTFAARHAPADLYDEIGCYKPFNQVLEFHNRLLRDAIGRLRNAHMDANFAYADLYRASYDVAASPELHGMKRGLEACCGFGGGRYNFDSSVQCGATVIVNGAPWTPPHCADPSTASNWDGVHPTEAFTKIVAKAILLGEYMDPEDAFGDCRLNFTQF